jgi:hypothetical protein
MNSRVTLSGRRRRELGGEFGWLKRPVKSLNLQEKMELTSSFLISNAACGK